MQRFAPLGALVAGPLADLAGLRVVFVAAAALSLAALPGFRVLTDAALARAEAAHGPPATPRAVPAVPVTEGA